MHKKYMPLLLLILLPFLFFNVNAEPQVVINEVELNPLGNDNGREEIEIYNPLLDSIDISGWTTSSTSGQTATIIINEGTILSSKGYIIINRPSQWLNNSNETIVLRNKDGIIVDSVGPFSDSFNDNRSWKRLPDGSNNWIFSTGNMGNANEENQPAVSIHNPPIANAGEDRSAEESTMVILNGSANHSDKNGALSYIWSQISGPKVLIIDANMPIASFVAPEVNYNTSLIFTLNVTDTKGATDIDTVNVTIKNVHQPLPHQSEPINEANSDLMQKTLKIIFIDVGQGDSTLIILPNEKTILIDGGERDRGQTILSTLRDYEISNLNLVIATHPHADHIGGLIDVIRNIPIEEFIDSGQIHTTQTFEDLVDTIDAKKIPLSSIHEGDTINLDPVVKIKVLNPPSSLPEGAHNEDQFNNNSVVLKLTYGNFTAIFPGDIEKETESRIAVKNIDADVLLASHHGSRGSNTRSYLDAVSPEVSIIYAGVENPYGHPHKEALERIKESGVQQIFRTDIDGTIVLETDGKGYKIVTTKSNITAVVPEFSGANVSLIIIFITALVLIINIINRELIMHGNNQS